MLKKFNLGVLRSLCKTDVDVTVCEEGVSEQGEPLESGKFKGKCRFVEETKIVVNQEGKRVELTGFIFVMGDIAPGTKKIAGGTAKVNGVGYDIYCASRPRNPDGSVAYTCLELI